MALDVALRRWCRQFKGDAQVRIELREEPSGSAGRLVSLRPDGYGILTAEARAKGMPSPCAETSRDPRAASIGRPGSQAENSPADLLRAIIDLAPIGIIVVDDAQRVVLTNRCSESILRRGEVLAVQADGRICAADPSARCAFAEFLRAMLEPTRGSRHDEPSNFLFARGKLPLVSVTAIRCSSCATEAAMAGHRILLSLRNLAADGGPPIDNISSLYGLTPAEAKLARALAVGKTIAQCSVDRGVSVNTTKTQLNALLGKTGLHRQVDLVRLLVAM